MTNFKHPHMERKPALSIIISAVQSVFHLDEAIESVLSQNFPDVEIIVICTHPTDRLGKTDSFPETDSRIHVLYSDDPSLSEIRTTGLERANGTYICFLNADDQLIPDTFTTLVKLMNESGGELIGFSSCLAESDIGAGGVRGSSMPDVTDPIEGEDLLAKMIMSETFSPESSMFIYRRSFLQNINRSVFDEHLNDHEFYTIRNLCMADRALSTSEEVFYTRNKNGRSTNGQIRVENLKGMSYTISQLLSFINKYPLKEITQQMILQRARELAHNLAETLHRLNNEKKLALSLDYYFSKKELSQLGYGIRIRNRYPGLYSLLAE